VEDDRTVRLADVLESGGRLVYRYDFGDDWEFDVKVEQVSPASEGVVYPRVTHGRRSAPPEDCGGVWGFEDILVALSGGAGDEEEAERLEWLREQYPYFSPEEFDLDVANEWVRRPQPFWE
jgi:hypothetical protein